MSSIITKTAEVSIATAALANAVVAGVTAYAVVKDTRTRKRVIKKLTRTAEKAIDKAYWKMLF